MALVSFAAARALSLSTLTCRLASVFSVGSLSGVPPPRHSEQAQSRLAASSDRLRLGLGSMVCVLFAVGAVVELRQREARLRRVAGDALLLQIGRAHV